MSQLEDSGAEGKSSLIHFCSFQGSVSLNEARPQGPTLSLQIHILIPARNTFTDITPVVSPQMSGHPWPAKWTCPVIHHAW